MTEKDASGKPLLPSDDILTPNQIASYFPVSHQKNALATECINIDITDTFPRSKKSYVAKIKLLAFLSCAHICIIYACYGKKCFLVTLSFIFRNYQFLTLGINGVFAKCIFPSEFSTFEEFECFLKTKV